VIIVAMTVDQIPDGQIEASVQLGLEPLCGSGVDGIGQDDAFGCDQKSGEGIVIVLYLVQIARYMGNLAVFRINFGPYGSCGWQKQKRQHD
jgi:hypothetical protein